MIRNLFPVIGFCLLISCTPPSPEQLAKETCDCFQDAQAKKNAENAIEASDMCSGIAQMNMRRLREIEQEQDMTEEQVKTFEDRFYNVYNKCK